MASKHSRHVLPALTVSGALMVFGCSAALQGGQTDSRNYAAQTAGEQQDATAPSNAKRPARRMRTSLSLPYFSFAQSLNPRS